MSAPRDGRPSRGASERNHVVAAASLPNIVIVIFPESHRGRFFVSPQDRWRHCLVRHR